MRWIIGDIHGMLRPLETLLVSIRARDYNPKFIFAGDYVNRGPDSARVIDLLLSLDHATFLRGNHDDIFDLILHGECYVQDEKTPDSLAAFRWFAQHGLRTTLTSYRISTGDIDRLLRKPNPQTLAQMLSAVPPAHRKFIRTLVPFVEFDDIFVAHALWDIGAADDLPKTLAADPRARHRLLWGRYTADEIAHQKPWRRTGYFGHTPVLNYDPSVNVPVRGPQIVLTDTGAALGPRGRLSAVCADSGVVLQIDPNGIFA
jgi:serine/threonine protein phosphatase 1